MLPAALLLSSVQFTLRQRRVALLYCISLLNKYNKQKLKNENENRSPKFSFNDSIQSVYKHVQEVKLERKEHSSSFSIPIERL